MRVAIICLIMLFLVEPCGLNGDESTPEASDGPRDRPPAYDLYRDVEYAAHDGVRLLADVFVPKGAGRHPAVLLIHGGAWAVGSKNRMFFHGRHLANRGYTAVSINYRLAPQHKFPAQIYDCKAAVRWMRRHADTYKIDPDRLAAFGYSAGGHLACLLGTTDASHGMEGLKSTKADGAPSAGTRIQAVVAGGAPCDLRTFPTEDTGLSFWLGVDRGKSPGPYEKASPILAVSPDDPPTFFYHGENDELVPRANAESMVEELRKADIMVRFHIVPQRNHIGAFFNRAAVVRAADFLDEVLKQREP